MILVHISAQGMSDETMERLLIHLEDQAGLWSLLHRTPVQVKSMTIEAPPGQQTLNEMVLE